MNSNSSTYFLTGRIGLRTKVEFTPMVNKYTQTTDGQQRDRIILTVKYSQSNLCCTVKLIMLRIYWWSLTVLNSQTCCWLYITSSLSSVHYSPFRHKPLQLLAISLDLWLLASSSCQPYIYNITPVSLWSRQRSLPSTCYDPHTHLSLIPLSTNFSYALAGFGYPRPDPSPTYLD
jgi:hypothetical protein